MGAKIHRTAIVEPGACLGEGVRICEYAIVRSGAIIGDDVEIGPYVQIAGSVRIGSGTRIFQGAAIGLPPQDLKYGGEPTELIIGSGNTIREFVTIHRGTAGGGGKTTIGNDNLIMAYAHIAHDCIVGDGVVIANGVQLGGHVTVEDGVVIGGLAGVHQFVRIGAFAMVGALSYVNQDVMPFALVSGNPASVRDVNRVGMRRHGFESEEIDAARRAIITIARSALSTENALAAVRERFPSSPAVKRILDFVTSGSRRGIMRGKKG